MSAYFVSSVEVTDPVAMQEYRSLAGPSVSQYGGRFLVRGSDPVLLEGEWNLARRMTIIEFADEAAVRRWYESPEYGAARASRAGAAVFNGVVLPGA